MVLRRISSLVVLAFLGVGAAELPSARASIASPDAFFAHGIKDSRGDICSAGAPQNEGGPCVAETDCGGSEEDTAWCVSKGLPRRLSFT